MKIVNFFEDDNREKVIVLCILSLICIGQSVVSFGQVDTNYIKPYEHLASFAIQSTFRDFSLGFEDDDLKSTLFQSRNLGLGIGIRYKSLGTIINLPIKKYNEETDQSQFEIGAGFNLYLKQYYIQGNCQYIEGFNQSNPSEDLLPVFQGETRLAYGKMISNYILNDRFSMRAAYQMTEQQKQSAGSFIISMPLSYQYFFADSLNITTANSILNVDDFHGVNIGLSGGYAHTFVYKNWSAMIFGSLGVEARYINLRDRDTNAKTSRTTFVPRYRFQGSLVYHHGDYFGGLLCQHLPHLLTFTDVSTSSNNFQLRLMVGKNF